MEDLLEDNTFPSLLACISNSSKFKQLCKTIYTLRSRYLLRGYKQEKITQKIMCKIFNTKNPTMVDWLNLKNTLEYYKIKNLIELDPKTIELALAIQHEMEKMKKKKKQDKHSKDYTLDEMLDIFQYRLEADPIFEKNSSSSSSASDNGDNHMSPEHPGLSYYDPVKHNTSFEGLNVYKEKSNIGKRKSRISVPRDEEDILGDCHKKEEYKRLKVPYVPTETLEIKKPSNLSNLGNLGQFKGNEIFYDLCKRGRESHDGNKAIAEKFKCFKL